MPLDQLKSIFAYRFDHDDSNTQNSAACQWASDLAGKAGAHLGVIFAAQRHLVSNVMGASLVSDVVGDQNRKLAAAASARADALKEITGAAGIDAAISTLSAPYPDIRTALGQNARLYDVVVADAAPSTSSMQRELLLDVLFQAARPLVIVPAAVSSVNLDQVVVAWDGTAPAARALNDAMPLLRGAKNVDVIHVVGDKVLPEGGLATDILPHLLRHGVAAQARGLPVDGGAAKTLQQHAESTQAGLLVMGAYAHSRFRQMVFGGVTSGLLKDCTVPLLMSH